MTSRYAAATAAQERGDVQAELGAFFLPDDQFEGSGLASELFQGVGLPVFLDALAPFLESGFSDTCTMGWGILECRGNLDAVQGSPRTPLVSVRLPRTGTLLSVEASMTTIFGGLPLLVIADSLGRDAMTMVITGPDSVVITRPDGTMTTHRIGDPGVSSPAEVVGYLLENLYQLRRVTGSSAGTPRP